MKRAVLGALAVAVLALMPALMPGAGNPPQAAEPAGSPAGTVVPTALITGSSRGIGLEFVRQYAARGWRVIATARHPEDAADLTRLAADNSRVIVEKLDVLDFSTIDALSDKYKAQPIDVLVNNAGIAGAMSEQVFGRSMNWALFDQVLKTNTVAPLKVAEAFLPQVEASRQKKIVNVSSTEGSIASVASPRLYFMRASKAALNMEMRNLALALKSKGIAVAIINPGPVDTDLMKGAPKAMLRSREDAVRDLIRITDQLTIENTGQFWNFDGKILPW